MESLDCDAPLGHKIQHLVWTGIPENYLASQHQQVVPWCLLKHTPQLKSVFLCHARLHKRLYNAEIDTMTAADILRVQTLCPNLEVLYLDVAFDRHRDNPDQPMFPPDILKALSQFKKPVKLRIYLHSSWRGIHIHLSDRWDFRRYVNRMLDERKRRQLPCEAPFEVDFKFIRVWENMASHYDVPDYRFWIDEEGEVRVKKRYRLQWKPWEEQKKGWRKMYFTLRGPVFRALMGIDAL